MLFSSPSAFFKYFESMGLRRGREPIPCLAYTSVRNWVRKWMCRKIFGRKYLVRKYLT